MSDIKLSVTINIKQCPSCGCSTLEPAQSGFIEIGQYNGDTYDREGTVNGYKCKACNCEFWINEGGV